MTWSNCREWRALRTVSVLGYLVGCARRLLHALVHSVATWSQQRCLSNVASVTASVLIVRLSIAACLSMARRVACKQLMDGVAAA
jgi:hypothetical protein